MLQVHGISVMHAKYAGSALKYVNCYWCCDNSYKNAINQNQDQVQDFIRQIIILIGIISIDLVIDPNLRVRAG